MNLWQCCPPFHCTGPFLLILDSSPGDGTWKDNFGRGLFKDGAQEAKVTNEH